MGKGSVCHTVLWIQHTIGLQRTFMFLHYSKHLSLKIFVSCSPEQVWPPVFRRGDTCPENGNNEHVPPSIFLSVKKTDVQLESWFPLILRLWLKHLGIEAKKKKFRQQMYFGQLTWNNSPASKKKESRLKEEIS